MTRILIVESRYYEDIAAQLYEGAHAELETHHVEITAFQVPGALEIPIAIRLLARHHYDGYVALGCVIRGETSHYAIVAETSARGLMQLGTEHGLAIGNGILTVDHHAQAMRRSDPQGENRGAAAARAALALISAKSAAL